MNLCAFRNTNPFPPTTSSSQGKSRVQTDMANDNRPTQNGGGEREPLLQRDDGEANDTRELLSFTDSDPENPRNWPQRTKMANVGVIAAMSILSPLASSMFTPGIQQIADDLGTTSSIVIGCTTGFVVMLGIGPLFLAPLSEAVSCLLYDICAAADSERSGAEY
jgi:hypothetical protein